MKALVNQLSSKSLLYRKLIMIENKALKTRKKIAVYEGVDVERYYTAIFVLNQKSRFFRKDAESLEMLYERLKHLQDHNFKYKILLFSMPFCSKAKAQMKEAGWRLIDVAA